LANGLRTTVTVEGAFADGALAGQLIEIVDDADESPADGQTRRILGNAGNVLTLDRPWEHLPTGQAYQIINEADGAFALNTQGGNDTIDASGSTLGIVAFGGLGNDAITGGSGDDILFGDRGRVDYFNDTGAIVTRLGDAPAPILGFVTTQVTPATLTQIVDGGAAFPLQDVTIGDGLGTEDLGLRGLFVDVNNGKGFLQTPRLITGNTATTLTIAPGFDPLEQLPGPFVSLEDIPSEYRISTMPEDQTDGNVYAPTLVISIDNANGGTDTVTGGEGRNQIIGGASSDTLSGGTAEDVIIGDGGRIDRRLDGTLERAVSIVASGGAGDTIFALGGFDVVLGGDGGDDIFANAAGVADESRDVVLGDHGLARFDGDEVLVEIRTVAPGVGGSDMIEVGQGEDFIVGGAAGDFINYNRSGVQIGDDDDRDFIIGDDGYALFDNFAGSSLLREISTIAGNGGNDLIFADEGADVVLAGDGADAVDAGTADFRDIVIGDNGSAYFDDQERLESIQTDAHAAGGDDDILVGDGNDVVFGGIGSDYVNWNRVSGTRIGGDSGRDVIVGDNGAALFQPGGALASIRTTDGGAELGASYDDFLFAGDGSDIALGGEGADHIAGGDGDDLILGDNGEVEFLPAGGGFGQPQTARTVAGGVTNGDVIEGNGGIDLVLGGDASDSIFGGEGDDLIFGDQARLDFDEQGVRFATVIDQLEGTGDVIEGNGGNDVIVAGTGDDTASGDSSDSATSGSSDGNDVVFGDHAQLQFHANFGASDYTRAANATLTSILTVAGHGTGDDILFGNGADDMLLGQQGADIIAGGDGDDDIWGGHNVLDGFDAGDTIDAGAGFDVVLGDNGTLVRRGDTDSALFRRLAGATVYDGATVGANATPAMVVGDFTRDITLLNHADGVSSALYGADRIAGGAGDDMLFGQLGDDTLQGDGSVTIDVASRSAVFVTGIEDASDGDDYIEGNGGADTLYGNLGQDDLIGGSSDLFGLAGVASLRPDGDDTIHGGAGTDGGRYHADTLHARDADVILGDNGRIFKLVGADGAYLQFAYDNYGEPQRIIPRAYQLLDYTPGAVGSPALRFGADLLFGESGDDIIHGMAGDDILFGNAGDDDLYGGAGNDWISGGDGVDGMLGDDGRIFTSRNGTAEALYGVITANAQETISMPGGWVSETIFVLGDLNKSVELEPWTEGGDDVMYGGLGDDFMHGGFGTDGMSGAEALQNFYDAAAARNQTKIADVLHHDPATEKFNEFIDTQPLAKIDGFFLNFEASIAGVKLNDGNDRLFGDLGNDWLVGGTQRDRLYGGLGDDVLNADDNLDTATRWSPIPGPIG
jgi:Ca2+-binding RTX toxin-like protein